MMKMKHLKFGLVAAGLLVSSCVLAQAKYVWIDEHGVKQFADTPPPGNIPDKNILKQPRRTAPQAPGAKSDASADTASTDDAKPAAAAPTTAERNADYNKRRAEQAKKDEKAAADAQKQEANAANCARAKQYLDTLNSGVRVSSVGADGQRSYMDDNQRAQETQRAQQAVNDCNKG